MPGILSGPTVLVELIKPVVGGLLLCGPDVPMAVSATSRNRAAVPDRIAFCGSCVEKTCTVKSTSYLRVSGHVCVCESDPCSWPAKHNGALLMAETCKWA